MRTEWFWSVLPVGYESGLCSMWSVSCQEPLTQFEGMACALWVFFSVGNIFWMCKIKWPRLFQQGACLNQGVETSLGSILWKVSNYIQNSYADSCLSFKDKTIKLWKITERDKRPEGYNLKDEEGKLKDLSTVTSLQVSCCLSPKSSCFCVWRRKSWELSL